MNDARSAVRRSALLGLKKLAENAALWPAHCIQNLVRAASDSRDTDHTMLCLRVMQVILLFSICGHSFYLEKLLLKFIINAAYNCYHSFLEVRLKS